MSCTFFHRQHNILIFVQDFKRGIFLTSNRSLNNIMQRVSNFFIDCKLGNVLVALYNFTINLNTRDIRVSFNCYFCYLTAFKLFNNFDEGPSDDCPSSGGKTNISKNIKGSRRRSKKQKVDNYRTLTNRRGHFKINLSSLIHKCAGLCNGIVYPQDRLSKIKRIYLMVLKITIISVV